MAGAGDTYLVKMTYGSTTKTIARLTQGLRYCIMTYCGETQTFYSTSSTFTRTLETENTYLSDDITLAFYQDQRSPSRTSILATKGTWAEYDIIITGAYS